jgi:hypothetical protein
LCGTGVAALTLAKLSDRQGCAPLWKAGIPVKGFAIDTKTNLTALPAVNFQTVTNASNYFIIIEIKY